MNYSDLERKIKLSPEALTQQERELILEAIEIISLYDDIEESKHRIHKAVFWLAYFSAMDDKDYSKDIVVDPLHYLGVIYDSLKTIGEIEDQIKKAS